MWLLVWMWVRIDRRDQGRSRAMSWVGSGWVTLESASGYGQGCTCVSRVCNQARVWEKSGQWGPPSLGTLPYLTRAAWAESSLDGESGALAPSHSVHNLPTLRPHSEKSPNSPRRIVALVADSDMPSPLRTPLLYSRH